MLISPALAQAGGAATEMDPLLSFAPIILIFIVFYFLLIRPQQKRMRQHKEMLAAIKRGDRIVTGGGIIGQVNKVIDDSELQVEIAEGVRVRVQRAMIAQVLAKTQPVADTRSSGRKRAAEDRAEADEDSEEPGDDTPAPEPAKPQGGGSVLKKFLGGRND